MRNQKPEPKVPRTRQEVLLELRPIIADQLRCDEDQTVETALLVGGLCRGESVTEAELELPDLIEAVEEKLAEWLETKPQQIFGDDVTLVKSIADIVDKVWEALSTGRPRSTAIAS